MGSPMYKSYCTNCDETFYQEKVTTTLCEKCRHLQSNNYERQSRPKQQPQLQQTTKQTQQHTKSPTTQTQQHTKSSTTQTQQPLSSSTQTKLKQPKQPKPRPKSQPGPLIPTPVGTTTTTTTVDPTEILNQIEAIDITTYFTDREHIASGGFGQVFYAKWQNNKVAVKQIALRETIGIESFYAIKKELDIISKMRHDRTLTLFHVCRDEKNVYLITRFYDKSLHQFLHKPSSKDKEKLPLTTHAYCVLVKDICEGLVYLHNYKPPILHLDLKPKNILLDGIGELRAVIADFGISMMNKHSIPIAGTNQYIAPEFYSTVATDKTDIYALAIVMWEMVHIREPSILKLKDGERPSWDETIPLAGEIKELIINCWAQDPNNRPSALKVLQIIENYMAK